MLVDVLADEVAVVHSNFHLHDLNIVGKTLSLYGSLVVVEVVDEDGVVVAGSNNATMLTAVKI